MQARRAQGRPRSLPLPRKLPSCLGKRTSRVRSVIRASTAATRHVPAAAYANDPRAQAIAAAARPNALREAWLNLPELARIEPEVVPGYPDRVPSGRRRRWTTPP